MRAAILAFALAAFAAAVPLDRRQVIGSSSGPTVVSGSTGVDNSNVNSGMQFEGTQMNTNPNTGGNQIVGNVFDPSFAAAFFAVNKRQVVGSSDGLAVTAGDNGIDNTNLNTGDQFSGSQLNKGSDNQNTFNDINNSNFVNSVSNQASVGTLSNNPSDTSVAGNDGDSTNGFSNMIGDELSSFFDSAEAVPFVRRQMVETLSGPSVVSGINSVDNTNFNSGTQFEGSQMNSDSNGGGSFANIVGGSFVNLNSNEFNKGNIENNPSSSTIEGNTGKTTNGVGNHIGDNFSGMPLAEGVRFDRRQVGGGNNGVDSTNLNFDTQLQGLQLKVDYSQGTSSPGVSGGSQVNSGTVNPQGFNNIIGGTFINSASNQLDKGNIANNPSGTLLSGNTGATANGIGNVFSPNFFGFDILHRVPSIPAVVNEPHPPVAIHPATPPSQPISQGYNHAESVKAEEKAEEKLEEKPKSEVEPEPKPEVVPLVVDKSRYLEHQSDNAKRGL